MSIAGWIIEGILFAFIGFLWVRLITDWVQMFARSWEPRGAALVFLESVVLGDRPADQRAAQGHQADPDRQLRPRPQPSSW
ncbi:hypothetical protein [Nocardioides convexus]|uniref:hypothetical protein n=1 Tax=Nocardioides convexus TaxID=2712224 RepID=UPI0024182D2D|nr:hypothetical protein [Nocardioides convexus]